MVLRVSWWWLAGLRHKVPSSRHSNLHTTNPTTRRRRLAHCCATPPPLASLSARSGTLALSLQSPLHLSLAVLVRYRSPTGAQPWVGLTTRFELQSQAARLVGAPARSIARRRYAADSARSTGLSPSLAPSSKGLGAGRAGGRGAPAGHTPALPPVLNLGWVPLHSPLLGESSFVSLPSAY